LGEVKVDDTLSIKKRKRPLGLTIITIVWLLGGLYNIYQSYQTIIMGIEVLPYYSDPALPEWFRFGLPAELASAIIVFVLGFIQLITIYGLWTGKSWSYKPALVVPILNAFTWIFVAAIYLSAPIEFGFREAINYFGVGGSIFWVIVYWSYLRQLHVKEYLGVIPPIPESTISEKTSEDYKFFRINRIKWMGSNLQYALIFTKDRLLFAKIGGQFADMTGATTAAGVALGGAVGGAIGAMADQKSSTSKVQKQDEKGRIMTELDPQETLKKDKDNFEILYSTIMKVQIKKSSIGINGARTGIFKMQLHDRIESFDIAPNQDFEKCKNLVISSNLQNKVEMKT
jgi:hypothetical protein